MSNEESKYCKHADCISHAISELSWMQTILPHRRHQLSAAAGDLVCMDKEVKCRRVQSKSVGGAPQAPLPERK